MKYFLSQKNKRGLKLIYLLSIFLVSIAFLVIFIFFYLSLHFKVGDFVYNKNTGAIGEIKGTSLPLDYLIQWKNESITQESLFNLKKLNELDDSDIQKISENTDYSFYPKSTGGYGIIFGNTTEINNEEVSGIIESSASFGNIRNFSLIARESGCEPRFFCSEWEKCQTVYNLDDFIKGKMGSGIQYRSCIDYSKCLPSIIDLKECELNFSIKTKKTVLGDKNYLEVYDKDDILISRIQLINETNKELNIQILLDETRYYPYCYDSFKDYDEDEIDCSYSGLNCPLCNSELVSLKGNLLMLILLLILVFLCIIFFIWYLLLWKRTRRK